jgi:hypothetical protein
VPVTCWCIGTTRADQPLLNSGNFRVSSAMMPTILACAVLDGDARLQPADGGEVSALAAYASAR